MSGLEVVMLAIVCTSFIISTAATICTLHGNKIKALDNRLTLELRAKSLDQQRNADQQAAEVAEAYAKGKVEGIQYTSVEIRHALEAIKAPQIIVPR